MTAPGRETSPGPGATVTGLFAAAELKIGELVAGRFRVEELIGLGGMGVVYRAYDEQLHVPVALKLLRPELAARPDAFARFRQELLLARQVSSPHVVRIHDIVAHDGRWLISMDYVAGGSLERLLDSRGALSITDATKIARQLALGLAAAHQRNVIHRDLKPANVLVTDALDAFITDFGVARSAGVTGITGSGVVVGTPEYLSPEQARADPVDHRSDLYALGLMLYEMLAGKPAFAAGTPAEMLAQRIVRSAPPVAKARPDVPLWLARLVARLTQLKPARRLQHAGEVVRAIDERRVPGVAPSLRRVLAVALAATVAAGGFVAYQRYERGVADAPRPVAPPVAEVRRVAVFPVASAADDAATAAALDALLAETFAASGVRYADAARVRRAMRQLGYDDETARRNRARIASVLGADRLLEPTLERVGERVRLRLARREPPDATQTAAAFDSGLLTPDALQPGLAQGLASLALAGERPAAAALLTWPQSSPALSAYGEGVVALARGAERDAFAAFERAVDVDASLALAWQQLIELAPRVAPARTASLAERAASALRGARGRDAERARGLAALAAHDTTSAIERLAPLVATAPDDRSATLALARALAAADRGDEAIDALERYAAFDPHDPEIWYAMGREAVRAGDTQRGVDDYLVRAQVAYTRLGDARGQADVANALGVGYERLGQLDAAREHFERAAAARAAAGDVLGAVASLRNLAWVHTVRGEFDAAWAATAKGREILADLDDPAALADLGNDEGLIAEQQGDFRTALARYREALALRRPLGNAALTAESLNNVGYAYIQVGEFDNARVFLDQARATYVELGNNPGLVRTAQSLALAGTHEGRWADARRGLAESLELAEREQMIEERAVSLAYLAELDRLEGRIGDALGRIDAARALFEQRGDPRGLAELALLRASTLIAAEAFTEAEQALAAFDKTPPPNREQEAMLSMRRAELALARGDAAAALPTARAARVAAGEAHALPVELAARLVETRALAAAGDTKSAQRELAALAEALAAFPSRALALEHARQALALAPATEVGVRYTALRERLAATPAYVGAAEIHALAALRLEAGGDAAAAAAAHTAADTARDALRAAIPRELIDTTMPDAIPASSKDPP